MHERSLPISIARGGIAVVCAVALAAAGWSIGRDTAPAPVTVIEPPSTNVAAETLASETPDRPAEREKVSSPERIEVDDATSLELDDGTTGSLVGRVVAPDGTLLFDWEISADGPEILEFTEQEGIDGEFRFGRLRPGPYLLEATHALGDRFTAPPIEVIAGTTVETTLVYEGPPIDRRIVVTHVTRPLDVRPLTEEQIVLSGADGFRRVGIPHPEYGKMFVFDDVPPGRYSLAIDDPRLEPWRRDGVRPGTRVRASLRGNASIVLVVVDEVTGERIGRYTLSLGSGREGMTVKQSSHRPPRHDRFGGLPPGPISVHVLCDGYADRWVELPDLEPHEERRVRISLQPQASISGVVLDADGAPVSGAKLLFGSLGAPPRASAPTGAAGGYSVAGLNLGEYALRAVVPRTGLSTDIVIVTITEHADVPDVALRFGPTGVLRGVVRAAPGVDLAGMQLVAIEPPPTDRWNGKPNARSSTRLDGDGRFEFDALHRGDLHVYFEMPGSRFQPGSGGPIALPPETRHDLGVVHLDRPLVDVQFAVPSPIVGEVLAVVRYKGQPMVDIEVRAVGILEGQLGASGKTDPDGRVRIGPLFPGSWRVTGHWLPGTSFERRAGSSAKVAAGGVTTVEIDF